IDRAREAAPAGAPLTFELADAGTAALPGQAFDLLFSRFGVMFFDDPAAAFAHMRGSLKPGGRLAFVCWRGGGGNDWVRPPRAAGASLLPPAPPPAPERIGHPTGVRALALDREQRHLFALITGAGARADRVVKVEIASLAVVGSYALDGGGVYRSLAVGPASGRVYVFGYRL
ncbi:MAG TPA: methyltransferase domain-containing protein, partial [Sphingopyxis sp.]|nr:methyltransferase domain-containing protein [Sphingopyxis sp.]